MAYPEKSYYDTLGVPRNATSEQIKAAYREQIKYFHPDIFQGNPEVAKQKTLELNEAYGVLSDPVKRDKYDFWLKMKDYQQSRARQKAQENAKRAGWQESAAAGTREEANGEPEPEKTPEPDTEPGPEAEEGEKPHGEEAPPEPETEPEKTAEKPQASASPPGKKRASVACVILAILLAGSIATGVIVNWRLQEKLDAADVALVDTAENTVFNFSLQAFYKRSEESLDLLFDTFSDFSSSMYLYTTIEEAGDFRNGMKSRIETNLQRTEEEYETCRNLEAISDDDAMLMAEVRRLTAEAIQDIEMLTEENWEVNASIISENAIRDSVDALMAKIQANTNFWEFYEGS